MENVYYMLASSLVTALLGWLGLKRVGRVGTAFKALKDTAELIFAVTAAVEDDKVTPEETRRIAKEAREAAESYRKIWAK